MASVDEALAWARRGFRIFPVTAGQKTPPLWENYSFYATTDEATIRQAWTQYPQANIGVDTTDMVVMDIDVKDERALASYTELGGNYETLTVRTPSGGYHCYFRHGSVRNRVKLAPGVDVRSYHGYVLAPGSFVFEPERGLAGSYAVAADVPLAPLPESLSVRLPVPGISARIDQGEVDTDEGVILARDYLAQRSPAIEGQGGNNHTYTTAAKLVRDFALSPSTATLILLEDWNRRCDPPWEPDALRAVVDHAAEYGQGNLGAGLVSNRFNGVVVLPAPEPIVEKPVGLFRGNAGSWADLKPRPWLVDRLLMRGETTVIAGVGAVGKSVLVMSIAAHFALGLPFGKYTPDGPLIGVLYMAEEKRDEQQRRLAAVCMLYNLDYDAVRANLLFISKKDRAIKLLQRGERGGVQINREDMLFLNSVITDNGAHYFLLDPVTSLHQADENSSADMNLLLETINAIAENTGTAALGLHHISAKFGGAAAGEASSLRGSSAFTTNPRIVYTLTGASKDDKADYGIQDHETGMYSRLDDAKANLFGRANQASVWLRMDVQRLPTGDVIGVPRVVDITQRSLDRHASLARMVRDLIIARQTGSISISDAARGLIISDPLWATKAETTVKSALTTTFSEPGVVVDNHRLVLKQGSVHNRAQLVIVLE